jgi:hypothetical protein
MGYSGYSAWKLTIKHSDSAVHSLRFMPFVQSQKQIQEIVTCKVSNNGSRAKTNVEIQRWESKSGLFGYLHFC